MLVEEHRLDGVLKLPSGLFSPQNKVSTAVLFFTRTDSGGTDRVWFYDVRADGRSLDDHRRALLPEDRLGVRPEGGPLSAQEHEHNNFPDVLARWRERTASELGRARTEQSFCVPRDEIAAQDYDLSLNRYKEIVYEEVEQRPPGEILSQIKALDQEIRDAVTDLEGFLG